MPAEASPVNARKRLTRWQLVLLFNGSGLLGIIISLFTLPSNTPFWWWVGASIVALAIMNFIVVLRFRRVERDAGPTNSGASTFIIAFGFLVWFLLEILPRILHR